MVIFLVMGIIFLIIQFSTLIKKIKEKNKVNILIAILTLFFLVFLFSGGILGGSAYNNASLKYELYETGHYYLVNHNKYKEVSFNIYIYMKIIQPVGIFSVLIVLIIEIYSKIKEKRKKMQN